jgi:hypothetical protein
LVGRFGAHLSLADAQEGLFIPEIDLDVPAPQKVLEELFDGHLGIGADQISGLAIEQSAAEGQPIAQILLKN